MLDANSTITELLEAWNRGETHAEERLFEQVEPILRRLASKQLSSDEGRARLRVTELVNESYLALVDQDVAWKNRGHFYSITARLMRRIVIDEVRRIRTGRRGSEATILSLDTVAEASEETAGLSPPDLIDLHHALKSLARVDGPAASCVELRFFAGLTLEEIADVQSVSRATIVRRWRFARAWLRSSLARARTGGSGRPRTPVESGP